MRLEGIFVPVLTPFRENGEIDETALRRLIDHLLDAGVSGIVPCGSTGESPYLSRGELRRIVDVTVDEVNGKGPVIAGAGTMGTRDTILQTRDALEAGADAALVVTPFYFKLSNEEVFKHYATLLEAVDLPILIYNVPKFTNYSIPPPLIDRLVSQYGGVIGVKDSSGDIRLMAEIIRLVSSKVSVLTGSGDTILPTLTLGGEGGIVAIGNVIPEICVGLYKAFKEGRTTDAAKYQLMASFVNKVLIKDHSQIAALKEATRLRGIDTGVPRQPILPLNERERKEVAEAVRSVNLT